MLPNNVVARPYAASRRQHSSNLPNAMTPLGGVASLDSSYPHLSVATAPECLYLCRSTMTPAVGMKWYRYPCPDLHILVFCAEKCRARALVINADCCDAARGPQSLLAIVPDELLFRNFCRPASDIPCCGPITARSICSSVQLIRCHQGYIHREYTNAIYKHESQLEVFCLLRAL